jgi:tetratricopeptide (TPR) repeat protein
MVDTNNVAALRTRLNEDINDIEAAKTLGNIYFDSGDAPGAILYYRHVLDLDPNLSGVRTDLGIMYWRNENLSLAEKAFRDVIASEPGFGHAYINLGLLMRHSKGNIIEARSIWQQLLDINPEHEVAAKAQELLDESSLLVN